MKEGLVMRSVVVMRPVIIRSVYMVGVIIETGVNNGCFHTVADACFLKDIADVRFNCLGA